MKTYTEITVYPLASSTQEKRFLLSYNGHYYEATLPLVELLEELQQNSDMETAVAAYVERKAGKYTPKQVKQAIDKFIVPILTASSAKKRIFLYERELFSSVAVDRFSDIFRFLFHRVCMLPLLVITVMLDVWFFVYTENLLVFNNMVNAYTVMGLLVFVVMSSLFHELGHASACKYFGVRHGGIGFGLYLNFPVLYTDVTEVWKLDRKQRVVVNLAGVYFQFICLTGLMVAFFFTGNDILRYLILIMNLGFVMTLNPFFKFDGYWIMSDLLGVPNLRSRSKELLSYVYNRLRRRPVGRVPYLLQIRAAERWGLLLYSVVVNLFMGFYFLYVIPSFLYRFVLSFPDEIKELILYLSNGFTPPFALLRNIGMQLIFVVLLGIFLTHLFQTVKRHVRRR